MRRREDLCVNVRGLGEWEEKRVDRGVRRRVGFVVEVWMRRRRGFGMLLQRAARGMFENGSRAMKTF
jgi:hypothetical protein